MAAPARWRPPRWLLVGWIVVCVVAGAARFLLATTVFDYVFGLLLVGLGLSYLRDARRPRAEGRAGDGPAGTGPAGTGPTGAGPG